VAGGFRRPWAVGDARCALANPLFRRGLSVVGPRPARIPTSSIARRWAPGPKATPSPAEWVPRTSQHGDAIGPPGQHLPSNRSRRATKCVQSVMATSPAAYPSSVHSGRTAIAVHQAFNNKVRGGWSNEGREVFAAWILALLGAALAVLLLASHQPSTSDLRLPQWSDPPIAGAESWADDLARKGDE
jgi:hypothetical protein